MKGAALGGLPWMLGNGCMLAAFGFTTDGSGIATLLHTFGGQMSIAKATNTYTVTLPQAWGKTYGLVYSQLQATLVGCTVTHSASAGTVTFAFGGAFNSGSVGCIIGTSTEVNG